MLLNILAKAEEATRMVSIGESALYAFLGFLVVFVGIALLIAIIWLVGKGMKGNVKANPAPIEVNKPAITKENKDEIDQETLAVITAALMAYYQNENPKCEFIVKRIKRI